MREPREQDDQLTKLFEAEKQKKERSGSFRLEPRLNEALLRSLANEKKERRLIIFMVTMAMVMMDISFVLLIAYYFTLAPWMIFALSFLILSVSGAIVLMFYGLNRLVQNKEVMNS
jgi:hypothetical protein